MACVEGNLNHKYDDAGVCVRTGCGFLRPNGAYATPREAKGGIASETLADIRRQQDEVLGQRKPSKFKERKEYKTELNRDRENRRKRVAGIITRWPHHMQGRIAAWLYGYEGPAFELVAHELEQLTAAWADFLAEFEIELEGKWMALGTLLFLEVEISMRQWGIAGKDFPKPEPEKPVGAAWKQ
jgi:hypothetical protein